MENLHSAYGVTGDVLIKDENKYYKRWVKKNALLKKDENISNADPTHAGIILDAMFEHAKSSMKIVTGSLVESVYGHVNLRNATLRFLRKAGAKLEIIILEQLSQDIKNHPLVEHLEGFIENDDTASFKGEVTIYQAPADFKKGTHINHFAVKDKEAFRFELSDEKSHSIVEAVANFNKPETAKILDIHFDDLKRDLINCSPYEIKVTKSD